MKKRSGHGIVKRPGSFKAVRTVIKWLNIRIPYSALNRHCRLILSHYGNDWQVAQPAACCNERSNACASERFALYARKGLNPVRTSFAKMIGSSHAAKCPPVSGLLK